MMRTTRMMSTSGVILMPAMISSSPLPELNPAITRLVGNEIELEPAKLALYALLGAAVGALHFYGAPIIAVHMRQQRAPKQVGLGDRLLDLRAEDIECNDRRNRDQKPHAGGDQRLRDGPHDLSGRLIRAALQAVEGANNAQNRAKESDKRRVIADGPQKRQLFIIAPLLGRQRPAHPLLDRRHSTAPVPQPEEHHPRFHRVALLVQVFRRSVEVLLSQQLLKLHAHRLNIDAALPIEDDALDHGQNAQNAEHDQKPEDPFGANKCGL